MPGPTYPSGHLEMENVVKGVLTSVRKPVYLMDVTRLTQLRKDGHPGAFGSPDHMSSMDCDHWCLPGVPDSWNVLLNNALLRNLSPQH